MLQGFLRMDPVEDLRSFIDATAPVQQGDFQADDAVPMSVNRIGRDSLGMDNAITTLTTVRRSSGSET